MALWAARCARPGQSGNSNQPRGCQEFGECKPLRGGVWELRIDWGPGYRVYYAMMDRAHVLLLCGGDKRKQSRDISRALESWKDYKERTPIP
ncbi:MAG: type II toxin-antitoxin system RelE/ParE family toxin [Candidatus Acidiferrales bacterium]